MNRMQELAASHDREAELTRREAYLARKRERMPRLVELHEHMRDGGDAHDLLGRDDDERLVETDEEYWRDDYEYSQFDTREEYLGLR